MVCVTFGMSTYAESNKTKVMKWRRSTKDRIINAFGGRCGVCGYDRCKTALELHHLDPETKEFSIAQVVSNGAGRKRLFPELIKCVLLCSNCHREVHANLVDIPKDVSRFNPNEFKIARSN